MIEIFEGMYQGNGAFIVRSAAGDGNRLMILGLVPCDEEAKKRFVNGEIWISDVSLTPKEMYELGKGFNGYRADQLLCRKYVLSEHKRIKKKAGRLLDGREWNNTPATEGGGDGY